MLRSLSILMLVICLISCGSNKTPANTTSSTESIAKRKFGIEIADLNDLQKKEGLSHGVLITHVYSFYPANKAGILKGDIIVNLDNKHIFSVKDFDELLQGYQFTYGQITLGISRNNQLKKIKVHLE